MTTENKQVWELPFTERPVLDFSASAAWVEVVPVSRGSTPRLLADARSGLSFAVTREGDVVRVRGSLPGLNFLDNLGPLRLEVPRHVRARIFADMGRVQVQRLEGCDLDVSTVAGSIELSDVRGRLKLVANAGQIRGERLAGTFDVDAGAGATRLTILRLDEGEHRVRSALGASRVELAPGLSVRIETQTVMGAAKSAYPSTADARAVLRVSADLGAVKVTEGKELLDDRHGDDDDWRRHWSPAPASAAASTQGPPVADAELRRVLTMLEEKRISAEEAERLIRAIGRRG